MMKYKQTDELQKYIDWENLMVMPRYAGGHDDQMVGLFKNVEVIGHWNEGDWQGMVATCVKFIKGKFKGKFVIYNDYYGSCSGCDSWENATDIEVKNMCVGLSNSAYIFNSIEDVKEYLSETNEGWSSWSNARNGLLSVIENEIEKSLNLN